MDERLEPELLSLGQGLVDFPFFHGLEWRCFLDGKADAPNGIFIATMDDRIAQKEVQR
jgi:hypothetical protein